MNEHVDILIVGAGISGIGTAYHVRKRLPGKSFAILEGRDAIGGTWDLFRYPGIRSDSDLHTFGYEFKPWTNEKAIADAPSILSYIRETADENGITPHIRFGHKVLGADWSAAEQRWTVRVRLSATGEEKTITCAWLFSAAGYYSYDGGFTPRFEGAENFQGRIVHPQQWPEDLDYSGKKVVVIGSGATAVTLVPAMTDKAEHVTMLQRSPSYIVSLPAKDPIANGLQRLLGERRGYRVTRKINIARQRAVYSLSRRHPRAVRSLIRAAAKRQLPPGYDIDTHFKPRYDPWDQRMCAVPNGDLFRAIRRGCASVVTDRVARFTERGILLESGKELEADVIVTATGLELQAFGGIAMRVDGEPVTLSETVAYKSMMLSGIPNFAFAVGYTNSSWTLKIDLVCEHLCRLIAHMDEHSYASVAPVADAGLELRPLLDFQANYVKRAVDGFPKQATSGPWTIEMSYKADRERLRKGPVVDPALRFVNAA